MTKPTKQPPVPEPPEVTDLIHFINATPPLLSLLYDLDLLPEQTKPNTRERCQMLLIAQAWQHQTTKGA